MMRGKRLRKTNLAGTQKFSAENFLTSTPSGLRNIPDKVVLLRLLIRPKVAVVFFVWEIDAVDIEAVFTLEHI